MSERLANLGYMGLAPEVTKGTPVPATDFVPLYDESMTTDRQLQDLAPIFGNKFETFKVIPGQRSHKGDFTVLAEPNTTTKLCDMLLTRGTLTTAYTFTVTSANATIGATYTNNTQTFTVVATIAAQTTLLMTGTGAPLTSGTLTKATGTGDATITFSAASNTGNTWPFTLSAATNPKSYTIDLSSGNIVMRYFGVEASKIVPTWNNNELQLKVSVSALGSFQGREMASAAAAIVTLKTDYDPAPTTGLVAGDLVRQWIATTGVTVDFTVVSVTATTVTLNSSPTVVSGDMLYLRPATVALTNLPSFLFSNTQFCFGSTAAAALAATQTRIESGSTWEVDHNFNNDSGEARSGAQDPAALVRTTGNAALTVKKFFDTPADIEAYNNLAKSACVIRHFSFSGGNTYELRVTLNNLTTDDPAPQMKSKEIEYSNIKYHPGYDQSDAQGMSLLVISGLASIT